MLFVEAESPISALVCSSDEAALIHWQTRRRTCQEIDTIETMREIFTAEAHAKGAVVAVEVTTAQVIDRNAEIMVAEAARSTGISVTTIPTVRDAAGLPEAEAVVVVAITGATIMGEAAKMIARTIAQTSGAT